MVAAKKKPVNESPDEKPVSQPTKALDFGFSTKGSASACRVCNEPPRTGMYKNLICPVKNTNCPRNGGK